MYGQLRGMNEKMKGVTQAAAPKAKNQPVPPARPNLRTPEEKPPVETIKAPGDEIADAIYVSETQEKCSKCGTVQKAERAVCWNCGRKFVRERQS